MNDRCFKFGFARISGWHAYAQEIPDKVITDRLLKLDRHRPAA